MATIKDVAKLAQVGVGTASRAISGRGAVSADALARVQAAVQALDFRPSQMARALSLKTTGMVGVYVPMFEGSFYSPILRALDATLRAADRHMVVTNGCGQGDERQQALQGVAFLVQRECDGIIVLSNHLLEDDLRALHARFPRLVLLNRLSPALGAQSFSPDHARGGRLAARALLSRGHRQIATIQGLQDAPDNAARMQGFFDELQHYGVVVPPAHRQDGGFTFETGYAATQALLQCADPSVTAVFCANDAMAMAAISCLTRQGRRVPQDMAVMGYDDTDVAAFTAPPLTTVHIPMLQMATDGCRCLLQLCYGLDLPVQHDFAPRVVWRDSVGHGPHPPIAFAASAS